MTPTQQDAALRLALEAERGVWGAGPRAAALLRELATVSNMETVEPVAYVDPRQLARGAPRLDCITRPEYRSAADADAGVEYVPVYTHPPQRQPLTDEQVTEMRSQHGWAKETIRHIERAIERAHGIGEKP